jgi:hypothetical protein
MPAFPIVLKTYEEYGPGNPPKDDMNNPSSSTRIGFLHDRYASSDFFSAISKIELDWISTGANSK